MKELFNKSWTLINPPILEEYDFYVGDCDVKYYEKPVSLGILHVARHIILNGGKAEIIDLQHLHSIPELYSHLRELPQNEVFGISNNFFTTQESSIFIAKYIRQVFSQPIVIGGSHIGEIEKFNLYIPNCYIYHGKLPQNNAPLPYELWPNINKQLFPLEVSNGCVKHCSYCHHPKFELHSLGHIKNYIERYINHEAFIYSTYNFGQVMNHDLEVLRLLSKKKAVFMTQSRPDTIFKNGKLFLEKSRNSGLKNLSLGMETINTEVLRAYKKTNTPDKWIEQTKKAIDWCTDLGISVKLNIMLFNGDNKESLKFLNEFLNEVGPLINGVIAGPIMVFPGIPLANQPFTIAKMSDDKFNYFKSRHCFPIKLSEEIDFDESIQISRALLTKFKYKSLVGKE